MKKYISLTIIIIGILLATGCKKEKVDVIEVIEEPVKVEEVVEEVEEIIEIVKSGIPSPLSGIYAKEENVNRRIVGVMFDNHPGARWQAGLKDAEIVYEFQVEAPYTRYLGLYLINEPKSLGPVRSSRPYFVTKVLEFDAIYVRVGGSEQANSDIISLKIADIDSRSSSSKVFWRNNKKKIPHNLYTSMDVIRETAEERNFRPTGEYEGFKFNEDDEDILGYNGNTIDIDYKGGNRTNYIYNEKDKLYYREKDGKSHVDESDNSPIVAKNIIIQEVPAKVIDNEGRLDITLVGEGKGKYFTNGVGKDIKWVKKDRKGKTFYYDENGQELILNPGVTWIQIISPKVEVIVQ